VSTRLHPLLVAGQRVAFEDDTEWLVDRVTPAAATVHCVAGKPSRLRHVDFPDGRSVDFLSRAGERLTISAHAAVRLLGLVFLVFSITACGSGPAALTGPMPLDEPADAAIATGAVKPKADLSIQLEVIPPDQTTQGWLWIRAGYSSYKPGCTPPEFSISPAGADIFTWSQDPYVAYVGGCPGTYTITAKGCGAIGSITMNYTGAQP